MLNFDLTEEQQILRDSIRDFAEKEIKPIAEELDEKEEFSLDLVKKLAELGLQSWQERRWVDVPELTR